MRVSLRQLGFLLLVATLPALAGCGDPKLPEAPSTSPFAASSVVIHQAGNAPVTIDASSVTFTLDDARTLQVVLMVTSQAADPTTVIIRGSLFNGADAIVGDATGGAINLTPGVPKRVQLTGPRPLGTISSATFEVSIPPPPTPLPTGSPAPASQLPIPPGPT